MNAAYAFMRARGWLDWSAVAVALRRAHDGPAPLMSAQQIDGFAVDALAGLSGPALAHATALIGLASVYDRDALAAAEALCASLGLALPPAQRKWRAASLHEWLEQAHDDPLYDLIELGQWWSRWGPAQGGFQRQGALAPEHYYTPANLQAVLRGQREWLAAEAAAIDANG